MMDQTKIKFGEERLRRWLNILCLGLIILGTIQLVRLTNFAGSGNNPLRRDIIQDYLISRAILKGRLCGATRDGDNNYSPEIGTAD